MTSSVIGSVDIDEHRGPVKGDTLNMILGGDGR